MIAKTDVLVIGGGIAGLMTAWYLARAGAGVTVAEAGDLGAQASGANAGSLHVQIQYPEFVAYGEGWGRLYAPSARFLMHSVAMWRDLPAELGEDLDVKIGGGLIVAQTEEQMRRIAAKAKIEAEVGVETRMLDRSDLRALAPYLSEDAIGAGYCPPEGKADPLRTTPALARAAAQAGVTILLDTPVTGIAQDRVGFRVATARGEIRAGRVVNTAGAQAAQIAAMLGVSIDLQGFPLQVSVTEPMAPLVPHLVYSAAGKLTLKQAANGGFIIGGGWSARVREGGGLATDPGNFAANMGMAVRVVPPLARVRVVRGWTAWVNGTADWRPIIGESPGVPGFFLGLFPWMGFSAGPLTARTVADLVLGRAPPVPLKGVSVLAG